MIIPLINEDIREVPASVLAYVGDSVYELFFRLHVASRHHGKSGQLNKKVIAFVKAQAQADAARVILSDLNDEETTIFRRGKNSNPSSLPKNVKPADYKYATGLEAVVGFLFLSDQKARLDELLNQVASIIEKGNFET